MFRHKQNKYTLSFNILKMLNGSHLNTFVQISFLFHFTTSLLLSFFLSVFIGFHSLLLFFQGRQKNVCFWVEKWKEEKESFLLCLRLDYTLHYTPTLVLWIALTVGNNAFASLLPSVKFSTLNYLCFQFKLFNSELEYVYFVFAGKTWNSCHFGAFIYILE